MGINGRQWELMVFYAFSKKKIFAKIRQKQKFSKQNNPV